MVPGIFQSDQRREAHEELQTAKPRVKRPERGIVERGLWAKKDSHKAQCITSPIKLFTFFLQIAFIANFLADTAYPRLAWGLAHRL